MPTPIDRTTALPVRVTVVPADSVPPFPAATGAPSTAPAVTPPTWSGRKTAVAASLAIGLASVGAIGAAVVLPDQSAQTRPGRQQAGQGFQGAPGGQGAPGAQGLQGQGFQGQPGSRGLQGSQGRLPEQLPVLPQTFGGWDGQGTQDGQGAGSDSTGQTT